METGWIKLHRSLLDSPIFKGRKPLCDVAAWTVILLQVNHSTAKFLIGGHEITCNAGESLNSLETWARLFRWDKSKVRRFFKMLQDANMIETKSESKTTRLTVCNWASYQHDRHETDTKPTPQRHETDTKPTPNNNDKNIKNDNNEKNQQATGFDFDKLARKVGNTCAKLIVEGGVGEKLPKEKKPYFLKWLGYKNEKGHPITTTSELFELVKRFESNTLETLQPAIDSSISNGYKGLIEYTATTTAKGANGHTSNQFPNYWKPGIEAELKLTPEQTNAYHRHLLNLGFVKEKYQGKDYWKKPQKETARNGEAAMSDVLAGMAIGGTDKV